MAEDDDVHSSSFRWNILNPFVPWRRMVATFYHGSPTPTLWKVIIEPLHRSTNFWGFRFSLKSGEKHDIIFTDRVAVDISLNGRNMENKVKPNYYFQSANQYKYEFETSVFSHPLRDAPHHLVIEVEISSPSQNIVNHGNGLVFGRNDLEQLSGDLMELYTNPIYSNLLLRSRDPPFDYRVHSYIMHARWSNFYTVHPDHTILDNTIEINISDILLRDVLFYVYSGAFNVAGPNWEIPGYTTELFQVIDRYSLHHLYKVFVRRDPQQVRTTRKDLVIRTKNFRLDVDGLPLNDPSFTWNVNPNGAYDFTFRIQFFWRPANPWFLYSLKSRSPLRIFAQVNLEFMKAFVGRSSVVRTVHQRDFTINSNEFVESGSCHFEGDSRDLIRFTEGKRRSRSGIRIMHFVRCILYLSDGTAVIEVERLDGDELQDDQERRLNVLSDHMYELMLKHKDYDLRVFCPADRPRYLSDPNEYFFLHKSIFKIRVPEWEAVLGNVLQGDEIPGVVALSMRSEAFRPLLAYIYSGKIFTVPFLYLLEVYNFAELGGMNSLRNLVTRMQSFTFSDNTV